jgi:predicted ferric reductase
MNNKPNTPETKPGAAGPSWLVRLNRPEFFLFLGVLVVALVILFTPAGNWLFAVNSQQLWWYVTRASGIVAFLLLWLSTAWGLAVPSKIAAPVLEGGYTFDFHQFISLLSIAFALLHVLVLMLDRYLPYTLLQILVPFLSTYRPLWVGVGILSFYIIILVTATFYIRARIGMNNFRLIHYTSLLAYLGVTLHGLYSGTDSPLISMQYIYRGAGLVIVFLTVYWLVLKFQTERESKLKAAQKTNRRR